MPLVNDRVWNPDSKLCNLSSSSPVYSIKHLETHCGAVFGKITCVRLLSIDKKTHYNQELFSAWKLSSPLPPTGINNVVITLSNWRKQDPDCGYRGLCVCVCVCVCDSVVSNSLWPHGLYPPGFSIHGNFPGKNTGVVAISFSRGSSQPRDQSCVSWISR